MPYTEAPAGSKVQAGDLVTVTWVTAAGEPKEATYQVGGDGKTPFHNNAEFLELSFEPLKGDPWANRLFGHRVGEVVQLQMPEENELPVTIQKIEREVCTA